MTPNAVEQIVRATLYEGYMLYPYRPTSVKNQQRWNFGVICPTSYSEAQRGTDAWNMQTECLVRAKPDAALEVQVRSLHLIQRQTIKLATPVGEIFDVGDNDCQALPRLSIEGQVIQTWQEAFEQEVRVPLINLAHLQNERRLTPFRFPAARTVEPVPNDLPDAPRSSNVSDVIVRTRECVEGELEVSASRIDDLVKVRVSISNQTPFANAASRSRDEALLCSMVSTHTILRSYAGEFVSLLDPPDRYRSAAAGCNNIGTWPVLVGQEGSKDTMLSSPIILYDYPQIADESPGDLFDGTEIDEILTLRIMTLTEEEKCEMRGADERAKKILERTEMLPAEQLMKMHGAVRGLRRMKAEG